MISRWLSIAVRILWLAGLARLLWVLAGFYVHEGAERHHLETAWIIFSAVSIAAAAVLPGAPATTSRPSAVAPATIAAWVATSLMLYYPSFNLGLLSDDFVLLALSPIGSDWQFFRPLPLAAWKIVYPLTGPSGCM